MRPADCATGQYHWVYCLTPSAYRATASWFTGWISIGGQIVFTASAAFAAGLQLQAVITLNHLETYVPARWQGMLFYWLVLAYSAIINIFGSKVLPHNSKMGFPFMQLFLNVTGSSAGATILALCISLVALAANAAGLTSTSRTAWAFARDNGLPGSQFFSVVNPTLKVPIRMVLMVSFLQMLLGLIYLGSSTAFNAVLSMAILGMYASYFSPIFFMLKYGRRRAVPVLPGTGASILSLGPRWGSVVNVMAMMWLVLAMVFSTFPTIEPVTADNMNYCVVVTMVWMVIGATYYYPFAGRKRFAGPAIELPDSL